MTGLARDANRTVIFQTPAGTPLMSFITLTKLQKSFGATTVLRSFDLGLEQGAFVSLPGPPADIDDFRPRFCLIEQGKVAGVVGVMQIARRLDPFRRYDQRACMQSGAPLRSSAPSSALWALYGAPI
jgi:hypothetical protein